VLNRALASMNLLGMMFLCDGFYRNMAPILIRLNPHLDPALGSGDGNRKEKPVLVIRQMPFIRQLMRFVLRAQLAVRWPSGGNFYFNLKIFI
jgi:hypothetical protein